MVASVAATLLVVLGVASVATAQLETCNGDLPPVLAANYSGLACQPVWNNFVLRVRMLCVVGVRWIIELLSVLFLEPLAIFVVVDAVQCSVDGCLGLVSGLEISQVSRTGVGHWVDLVACSCRRDCHSEIQRLCSRCCLLNFQQIKGFQRQ